MLVDVPQTSTNWWRRSEMAPVAPDRGPARVPPKAGRNRHRDNAGRRPKRRIRAQQNYSELPRRWRRVSATADCTPGTSDLLDLSHDQHVTGSFLHAFSAHHQTEGQPSGLAGRRGDVPNCVWLA